MEILAKNLALLRKNAGITRGELAERVGVGVTTITNIETGYTAAPPTKLMDKLAETFGTTVDAILGIKNLEIGERSRVVYVTESISNEKPFLEVDKIIDTMFIDRDKIKGYDHIGLRINDNSMENVRICKGDTVLVRQNAFVHNGDIVVVVYKTHDAVVRKYYDDGEKIILKAEGDYKIYPDIILDKDKDRIVIIGKVVNCMIAL